MWFCSCINLLLGSIYWLMYVETFLVLWIEANLIIKNDILMLFYLGILVLWWNIMTKRNYGGSGLFQLHIPSPICWGKFVQEFKLAEDLQAGAHTEAMVECCLLFMVC